MNDGDGVADNFIIFIIQLFYNIKDNKNRRT